MREVKIEIQMTMQLDSKGSLKGLSLCSKIAYGQALAV